MKEIELLSKKYTDELAYKCTHLSKDKKKETIKNFVNFSNQFLQTEYNLTLEIPIILTQRFKIRLAELRTYAIGKKVVKQEIVFSERFIVGSQYDPDINAGKASIEDTLKHELVHYAMFRLGKHYHDGDADFENELSRLNICSSETTAHKNNYFNANKIAYYFICDDYCINGKTIRLWHTIDPVYINRSKIVVIKSY